MQERFLILRGLSGADFLPRLKIWRKHMKADKLDVAIAQVAYILDVLRSYRAIVKLGDCNNCWNNNCQWKPKPGQMTRYNCPHYKASVEDCDENDTYWLT